MKQKLILLLLASTLFSCAQYATPRALNSAYLGMSVESFMEMSHNRATIESIEGGYKIYRYEWAAPGSTLAWNTTFYYFQNDRLVQMDGGVRNNNVAPPQLRLNYNLN